ncbi:MAG: hypothetical protein KDA37_06770 [Planctomycetales bacterium]|nr:hypothetical protein [Planctomycetales bacterium]
MAKLLQGRVSSCPKGRVETIARMLGCNLAQLAARAGLEPDNVDSINNGNSTYTKTIEKLAKALGVDVEVLTGAEIPESAEIMGQLVTHLGSGEEFAVLRQEVREFFLTQSLGHPNVEAHARKLRKLCSMTEQRTFHAYLLLRQCLSIQGKHEAARQIATFILTSATTPAEIAHGDRALGECYFYLGELEQALGHLDIDTLDNLTCKPPLLDLLGLSPLVSGRGHAAMALAAVGRVADARQCINKSLEEAENAEHLPSLVFANLCDATVSVFLAEPADARRKVRVVLDLTSKAPTQPFRSLATIIDSWAQARLGEGVEPSTVLGAFAEVRRDRANAYRPLWLSLVADALLHAGHPEIGSFLIEEAEYSATHEEDRIFASENLRLKGEALSQSGKPKEALEAFEEAVQIASQQGAHLFALRSALAARELASTKRKQQSLARQIKRHADKIAGPCREVREASRILTATPGRRPKHPR